MRITAILLLGIASLCAAAPLTAEKVNNVEIDPALFTGDPNSISPALLKRTLEERHHCRVQNLDQVDPNPECQINNPKAHFCGSARFHRDPNDHPEIKQGLWRAPDTDIIMCEKLMAPLMQFYNNGECRCSFWTGSDCYGASKITEDNKIERTVNANPPILSYRCNRH